MYDKRSATVAMNRHLPTRQYKPGGMDACALHAETYQRPIPSCPCYYLDRLLMLWIILADALIAARPGFDNNPIVQDAYHMHARMGQKPLVDF